MQQSTGRIDTLDNFEKEGIMRNELIKLSKASAETLKKVTPNDRIRRQSDTFESYRDRVDPNHEIKENKLLKIFRKGYVL